MPATVRESVDAANEELKRERDAVDVWLNKRKSYKDIKRQLDDKTLKENERAKLLEAYAIALKDYRTAGENLASQKLVSDMTASAAVQAVAHHFHLTPSKTDLNDTQASSHRLSPWAPMFKRDEVFDLDSGRWRLRTPNEEKAEVQRRAANQTRGELGPTAAITSWYDGAIALNQNSFTSAETLAATVYHETSHWLAFMAMGGVKKGTRLSPASFFQLEVDAYRREAEFYKRMGKTVEAKNRADAAAQYQSQRDITLSNRLTWADIQNNQTYRGWLGVNSALRLSSPDEAPPTIDEGMSALREIQEGALALRARKEAEGDERIREVEQPVHDEEHKRQVHVRMANAAIDCGLEPVDTWNARFHSGQDRIFNFQFKDEPSYRASLLLLSACYSHRSAPPCVDSFATLKSNWSDPAFRDKLLLGEGSSPGAVACVATLATQMEEPARYEDLLNARDRFWANWRRGAPSSGSGTQPLPQPPSAPQAPREPREPKEPTPPREDIPWCLQAPGRRCIR